MSDDKRTVKNYEEGIQYGPKVLKNSTVRKNVAVEIFERMYIDTVAYGLSASRT